MPDRRYMLHPGDVISANDGQRHHVGVVALLKLYGLTTDQAVVCRGCQRGATPAIRESNCQASSPGAEAFIHLWPRGDGHYRLPAEEEVMDS